MVICLDIKDNLDSTKTDTKVINKPNNGVYDLESTIEFGKYKNLAVCDIIDMNPNYLIWAIQNIDRFKLSESSINKLSAKIVIKDSIIKVNNSK